MVIRPSDRPLRADVSAWADRLTACACHAPQPGTGTMLVLWRTANTPLRRRWPFDPPGSSPFWPFETAERQIILLTLAALAREGST